MESRTLKIEGMTCGHCVARVKKGLSGLDGVSQVEVSLEDGEAQVTYEEQKVDLARMKEAVEEAGYKIV